MQKTKLNEELFDIMINVARIIKHRVVPVSYAGQLTLLQLEILIYLFQEKKIKSVDMAKHFCVTKPTISIHLERLERLKLIKRFQNEKDRRSEWISLTAKGKNLLNKYIKQRRDKINQLLTFISETEKKQLLTIIKNLAATLENKL
jgi:DNA-binding MarR family transcriptional regulator